MGLSLVIGGRGSEKEGGGGREVGLVKFSLVYFFVFIRYSGDFVTGSKIPPGRRMAGKPVAALWWC